MMIPDVRDRSRGLATEASLLRVRHRDELIRGLNERGIFPGVHYRDNTEYAPYRAAHGTCRRAACASAELVSLPLHLRLSPTDVDAVADGVLDLARNG